MRGTVVGLLTVALFTLLRLCGEVKGATCASGFRKLIGRSQFTLLEAAAERSATIAFYCAHATAVPRRIRPAKQPARGGDAREPMYWRSEAAARGGGKLKIIADIEDPQVVAKILSYLECTAPRISIRPSFRLGHGHRPCRPACFELGGRGISAGG